MWTRLSDTFSRFSAAQRDKQLGGIFLSEYNAGLIGDDDIVKFKVGFDAQTQNFRVGIALKTPDSETLEHRNILLSFDQIHQIARKTTRSDIVREITRGYDLASTYYSAALTGGQGAYERDR